MSLLDNKVSGSSLSKYAFTYDVLGNITELTDNAGSTVATYRYTAFGDVWSSSGSAASENQYRFSTKPLDEEVLRSSSGAFNAGLYYYGFRYYDPQTGRWPSRDPIAEYAFFIQLFGNIDRDPKSEKLLDDFFYNGESYSFIKNDPVGAIDYLGLLRVRFPKPVKPSDLILKPNPIGAYVPGYTNSSEACFDSAGNGLPCPGDIEDSPMGGDFDDLAEYCQVSCDTKRCEVTVYMGVYRPELGYYSRWNWQVGCDQECGEPQGDPVTGRY